MNATEPRYPTDIIVSVTAIHSVARKARRVRRPGLRSATSSRPTTQTKVQRRSSTTVSGLLPPS
jgi:hypothetical protein